MSHTRYALSSTEYVSTLPLTSSNSTKPGHLRHSLSKSAKPASGCPRRMYSIGVVRHLSDEKLSSRYTDTVIRLRFALL